MQRIPGDDHKALLRRPRPAPGAFAWQLHERGDGSVVRYLHMQLPGGYCNVPVRPVPPDFPYAAWEWDGNEDRPTLTPSVHAVGRWHGWIRDGRMVSC